MALFTGTSGNDNLKGTTDADTLQGLTGDDSYTVDHTDDVVLEEFDEGIDKISSSVVFNLSDNVENLVLTGAGSIDAKANDLDNSITGNKSNNRLYILDGVDTVIAGLGDDSVEAGAFLTAEDRLDGGAGIDRLRLDGDYSGGVTLDAATVVNFEKITLVDGNSYDLTLSDGTNSSTLLVKGNRLTAGTLNLDGSAESKSALTAFGGTGDDTLIGGGGDDVLRGGEGADILTGGAGKDTASYATSKSGVTVDLTDNGNNDGGDALGDTLTGIENITGSDFEDSLTGDDTANVLDGGNGDDTLMAGAGIDKILGGGGFDTLILGNNLTAADTIDGGDDYDLLSFGGDFSAGLTLGKTITNIEEILVDDGNSYKFTLTAAANSSTLLIDGSALTGANRIIVNGAAENLHNLTAFGGAGNDSLVGGLVADTLSGGSAGNDTILAGGGDDTIDQANGLNGLDKIDGGAGKDTLLLAGDYSAGVTFSATTVTGVETILLDAGFDYSLTLNNSTNKASLTVDGQTLGAGTMIINGAAETSNALTLLGGAGDDKLTGGGGADSLIGGLGADTLVGGGGLDTASYELSADGVVINLVTNVNSGGDAEGDSLSTIEHVIGTVFDDQITGSAAANKLTGGLGNDTLGGGAGGNDLLDGGEGDDVFVMAANMTAADTLIGGAGIDTLELTGNYAGGLTFGANTASKIEQILLTAGNSYKITLNNETAGFSLSVDGKSLGAGNFLQLNGAAEASSAIAAFGGAGKDVLLGGGGDDNLVGNGGNDTLTGGEGGNFLEGGDGADVLSAGGGDDVLDGGANDDKLTAGNGDNILIGGDGADVLTAGTGDDNLDGGAGNDKLTAGNGNNTLVGGAGLDTLIGGADDDVIVGDADADSINGGNGTNQMLGGAGADTIVGGSGADTLDGGADNDSLSGGGGTNMFVGGAGADTIVGGAGIDTVSYGTSGIGVTIDLTSAAAQAGGDAAGDRLSGIENVSGSAKNDSLTGGAGNNLLQGAGGVDTLRGGSGNDTLDGGAGTDILDGGAGIDLASYASAGSAVTINLLLAAQVGGDADGESFVGIEGILGSGFNDTLIGNTAANSFAGGGGDDQFVMGANLTAADSIDGGAGTDTLVLNGNYAAGLTFAATTMKDVETIQLAAGNSYKLTLTDANNSNTLTVDGSALGANTLFLTASAEKNSALTAIGASGNDTLTGGGGNDSFTGGAGADKLTGGAGSDTANYGSSAAAVTVDLASATAQVSGGDANGDILSGIENVIGTNFADKLTGSSAANALSGGDDNDTLIGGAGADALNGGDGDDTADYSGSKAGISINLGGGVGSGGDAAGDTLTEIESVIGSKFNDNFVENDKAHTLQGGAGTDTVDYSGSDKALTADLGAEVADNDSLIDIESIIGTKEADEITGSGAGNRLAGGLEADTLNAGGGGDDTLLGGEGADYINIADTLTAKDQIDGGSKAKDAADDVVEIDKLEIAGDYSAGLTLTATTIQNIEEIILKDGFNYAFKANNATNGEKLTIDASELGVGSTLNFDASAETGHSYTFRSGAGADTLTGGKGIDLLDFSKASSGAIADLSDSTLNDGFALGDVYAKIENIRGSNLDDVLTGDKVANVLEGGLGDDFLFGGAGNDTLSGGQDMLWDEKERLVGNDGFDGFDGGDGIDLITFANSADSVIVDLLNGVGGKAAEGDAYINIEYVVGTKGDDEIYGDASDNRLEGGDGGDILTGDFGNDTLLGGRGADVFIESFLTAKDQIDGGPEVDKLNTPDVFEGDTLQLNGDYSQGLTFAANTVRNVEKFDLVGGTGGYVLRLDNATNSSTLIVDASTLGDTDIFKFDGSKETGNAFTVFGGLGNDTIIGGGGADILEGGFGADSLVGGKGLDTASYSKSFDAVTVDLSVKGAQAGPGDATGDVLVSIENLTGTDFDDLLIGDKIGNVLEGGKGNDTLNGGLGTDIASYEHFEEAVGVVLLDSTKNTGAAAGDVYISIEGAIGTKEADTIVGNGSANYIAGGEGDDTLTAGSGNDTILGGDDKDFIEMGFGLNALDRIDGGDGKDTVVLDGNYSANVTLGATTLVNVETLLLTTGNSYRFTLADGNNQSGLTIDGSTLEEDDILVINGAAEKSAKLTVLGGADNDSITGGAGDDKFVGGLGNDLLVGNDGEDDLDGGDGNDKMSGGLGADSITGGTGVDTMQGGAGGDKFIMLGNLSASDRIDGGTERDRLVLDGDYSKGLVFGAQTMINVEVIELTGKNDYWLVLDQATNGGTLDVDARNLDVGDNLNFNGAVENKDSFDVVSGKGDDTIIGGAGADSIDGGAGGDILNGGLGIDTVIYNRSLAGVTVDLTNNANNSGGDAEGDVLSNFENIVGSGNSDKLTGNSLANLIEGGFGGDTINGGLGIDTVTYIHSGPVFVDLAAGFGIGGEAQGDKLIGIENIIGSEVFQIDDDKVGDALYGNDQANVIDARDGYDELYGRGGNDLLIGGAHADWIEGGAGADTLDGGTDRDWASYASSSAGVTVDLTRTTAQASAGDALDDILIGIDNLRGSDLNDRLKGNSSSNIFMGGTGADTLIGGGGADATDYADSSAAVIVDLNLAGAQKGGSAAGDVLIGIGTVWGSDFNDRLTGNAGNNGLNGGYGADTLTGGAGSDLFEWDVFDQGVDLVTDFKLGLGGDTLQIGDVLIKYNGEVDDFVRFVQNGKDVLFQVDANGEAGGENFVTLAVLANVSLNGATAQDMLDNGNLDPVTKGGLY